MGTQKKYIYVVNPISGDVDKEKISKAVHTFAQQQNIELVSFETTEGDDKAALLDLFKEHQPERVLIAGGDGTIKMVAEALESENVILGILPAGSANGLTVDLDFPKDLEEQIKIAFLNDFDAIDMVCINNKKSLHLSDLGLNAELIRNYEQSSIRGKLGYALQAVNTMTSAEVSFNVRIEANDTVMESEAKMVVIANSQKYGTGVIINPDGKMDDGKFEIIVLKDLTPGIFAKFIGGEIPLEHVEIISTSKARISSDIEVDFQIDGEYCGVEKELDVYILKQQMKVAVPRL